MIAHLQMTCIIQGTILRTQVVVKPAHLLMVNGYWSGDLYGVKSGRYPPVLHTGMRSEWKAWRSITAVHSGFRRVIIHNETKSMRMLRVRAYVPPPLDLDIELSDPRGGTMLHYPAAGCSTRKPSGSDNLSALGSSFSKEHTRSRVHDPILQEKNWSAPIA